MSLDFKNFAVPHFNGFGDEMENEEDVEDYFEHDHESDQYFQARSNICYENDSESVSSKEDSSCTIEYKNESVCGGMRKSMSTGNLLIEQEDQRRKELMCYQNKQVSQCDAVLGVSKQSGCYNQNSNLCEGNGKKYVSVAELVYKFWMQTPERFRSKPRKGKAGVTIPKTPLLHTKDRSRPLTVLSRDQIEEMELREAQKYQIKAHPVNKKILAQPSTLMPIIKKNTTPKPFNLTEVHAKNPIADQTIVPQFHARAVPKSIYTAPKLRVPLIPNSKAISRFGSATKQIVKPAAQVNKPLIPTEMEPFSFDHRHKQTLKRKEDLINKLFAEEKNARIFKARPVPKAILSKHNATSTTSVQSSKSDEDLNSGMGGTTSFKATFPKVLYKQPFVPKKAEPKALAEISTFQLNTECRAKERREFDKKLQERQEEINKIRAQHLREEKEREQDAIQQLRKDIEFKANPVRRFKEVNVQPSGKVTVPRSPNFKSNKLNKENLSK